MKDHLIKYTKSHEWIRVDGERGIVGISLHAKEALGEIAYVSLPEVGREVRAGEEIAVLESTKSAIDIYTPLSGAIVRVNEMLSENPDALNRSPEKEGWLFEIALSMPGELDALLSLQEYRTLLGPSESRST